MQSYSIVVCTNKLKTVNMKKSYFYYNGFNNTLVLLLNFNSIFTVYILRILFVTNMEHLSIYYYYLMFIINLLINIKLRMVK